MTDLKKSVISSLLSAYRDTETMMAEVQIKMWTNFQFLMNLQLKNRYKAILFKLHKN